MDSVHGLHHGRRGILGMLTLLYNTLCLHRTLQYYPGSDTANLIGQAGCS